MNMIEGNTKLSIERAAADFKSKDGRQQQPYLRQMESATLHDQAVARQLLVMRRDFNVEGLAGKVTFGGAVGTVPGWSHE